jgi:hypothetical protein
LQIYEIELLGDINFQAIQNTLLKTILPWFDQTATITIKGLLEEILLGEHNGY